MVQKKKKQAREVEEIPDQDSELMLTRVAAVGSVWQSPDVWHTVRVQHIRVTRDGRKHRVRVAHIRAAMKDAGMPTRR